MQLGNHSGIGCRSCARCGIIRCGCLTQAGRQGQGGRAAGRRKGTMAMMMTAIGLMSGTSLDGVDVALIETDGRRVKSFGPSGYRPYSDHERGLWSQALSEAADLPQREARPGIRREAEHAVTIAHAEAVAAFTAQNHLSREDVDIVGFHGQTVLHRPSQKMTVQI